MFKKNLIIGIIIVLALLIIILAVVRKAPPPEEEVPAAQQEVVEPEVISGVPAPLASGKQVYRIMTNSSAKFKITEAEFDPLDVKEGESQRVKVLVEDLEDKPITSENEIEGMAFTDNKETPFSFELRQVSDANGATLTEWEGFWILEDTYDKTYMVSITAKAADQEHKIELTFR
jgi:cytoskeletal protein RodZ